MLRRSFSPIPISCAAFSFLIYLSCASIAAAGTYYPFTVDQDRLAGAPDFSALNHPLTPADRIFAKDGHFFRVGADLKPGTADDEQVRFFGTSLVFSANFPAEKDAARLAKRFRRLGINLIRLHHLDAHADEYRLNSLLSPDKDYPAFNPHALKRLKAFVKALAAEGIYIDLTLRAGYEYEPHSIYYSPAHKKPLGILDEKLIELQKKFMRDLIRELDFKDSPALALIEFNNECSLTDSWQRGYMDKNMPKDALKQMSRGWNEFLENKYASTEKLKEAWGADFPREGESLEKKNISLVSSADSHEAPRYTDYLSFLVKLDRHFFDEMRRAAREAAGNLVPLHGTQMRYGGLLLFDSAADLDFNDNHFYIDYYDYPRSIGDPRDWRIRNGSIMQLGLPLLANLASSREQGKPYVMSEYNQPWPNTSGAEINPVLAAFGAFQDWDALIPYSYSHNVSWDEIIPSGLDLKNDVAKLVNMGQAAWLLRGGNILAGLEPAAIAVPKEIRLRSAAEKANGDISEFLKRTFGYEPENVFRYRVALAPEESNGFPEKLKQKTAAFYTSDTGQITTDKIGKVFRFETKRAAGIYGFIKQNETGGAIVKARLAPSARGYAAIMVSSLDGLPLPDSHRLLITNPGAVLRSEPRSNPAQAQELVKYPGEDWWWTLPPDPGSKKPSGNLARGWFPLWMEKVETFVTLRTNAKKIYVFPLDGSGKRLWPLKDSDIETFEGGFRIHLQSEEQTLSPWFEVLAQ